MDSFKDLYGADDQEAMYQHAISRPLAEKIEQALLLIQTFEGQALDLSPDGYYVCNSFGKDSGVMVELFKMSGVKFTAHYNVVTLDPPELVLFGREHHPATIWEHKRVGNLPAYMKYKSNGPPTRLSRWCCEIYKEQGGPGRLKATGVRGPESPRRKGLWRQMNISRNDGSPIVCPIVYWTDSDVWTFTRQRGIPYCSLYDEGYKRLGCIGCPMGGSKQQAQQFARWPKYEAMWRRGFQMYWDRYKGTLTKKGTDRWIEKFGTVDDLWDWWVSDKAYEGEQADCQMWLW